MKKAAINIHQTIRDVYTSYCKTKGFNIGKKVEKLLIMDLYKAGYDVSELIILNKGQHKVRGPELKKRPIVEPKIEPAIEKSSIENKEENKEIEVEDNGI